MADNLPQFPIVELEDDYPEAVGKLGLYDYYMPVGNTGIVFVAALQGRLQAWGPVFSQPLRQAANLRAASTLAQWGLVSGDTFAFMRSAVGLTQADVATLYGVPLLTVMNWENNVVPVPRSIWLCMSYRVCLQDGRSPVDDLAIPQDFRPRRIRVFPNIPGTPMVQPETPPCPPPPPCLPPRDPNC